ncbi:hypothetical protein HDV62DRAFT_384213 [Trichoderma sp. SZMC 28011]
MLDTVCSSPGCSACFKGNMQGCPIRTASFHLSSGLLPTATLSLPSGSQPAFRGTSSNWSSPWSRPPSVGGNYWSASQCSGDLVASDATRLIARASSRANASLISCEDPDFCLLSEAVDSTLAPARATTGGSSVLVGSVCSKFGLCNPYYFAGLPLTVSPIRHAGTPESSCTVPMFQNIEVERRQRLTRESFVPHPPH